MPSKLETICYIYECSERMTRDYTLKEMTTITKMDEEDPKIITYLRVKAFIPLDESAKHNIHPFEIGDVVYLKGKFIGFPNWYQVCLFSYLSYRIYPKSKKKTQKNKSSHI